MLQVKMPGEVLFSSDRQGGNFNPSEEMDDPNRKLQEMAEKLEKSEAGRKKLRQAIAMLKEKMEATEKVLQVNETLRQECEKERLRAETESKKAKEEKTLRMQIEKENLSIKEQLVGVLQRLDAVEKNSKSDRAETLRVRGEMQQALSALGGALQVAEAALTSVQGLEKAVQDKVNNSVSTSTRALSLAQSLTTDVKAAQAAAASAEKSSQSLLSRLATVQKQSSGFDQRVNLLQQETSKAFSLAQSVSADAKGAQVAAASAEKLSQTLVARVAAVQKQSAGLDLRVNLLQQELRTRFVDVGATLNGVGTANGSVPGVDKKVSKKGMVLSKSQQPIGATVSNVKPPYRSSAVGSSELSRDIPHRGTVVASSGPCGQPESHHIESIQFIDSGSSSVCTSTVSRELEPSVKNKVSNQTRYSSITTVTKRHSVTSPANTLPVPRVQNSANTPVSRGLHSRSSKCTSGQEGAQSTFKAGEGLRKVNGDNTNGSFLVPGEPGESRPTNTDATTPQIPSVPGRKMLPKRCSETGRITSDFSGRQRICDAGNIEEDKPQALPLRVVETEKDLKDLDVGEDTVAKGKRKVKLPAALLKDITKLFSKEKKVQVRMEAKFMALEDLLRSGWEGGTFAEQISGQVTRKRKRRKKVFNGTSNEGLIGDSDKKSKKKPKLDTTPQIRGVQVVGNCFGGLGKKANRNKSKDGITVVPSTPVQSTPPFAMPKVSGDVAEISTAATLQEQLGKKITGGESRPVSSVSDPDYGEGCRGFEQRRRGMVFEEENVSEGVKWCRDVDMDKWGTNQWTVTCSSGLPERAGINGDCKEHDMDTDKGNGKAVDGTGYGWDTESDCSEDEFDPEWWTATERVLLSPTLPELRPSTLSEGTSSDTGLGRPEPEEMSLEDVAFLLDVLPPIPGEGCEEEFKDVELPPLSDRHTLDQSFSDSAEVDIVTSLHVDARGECKATQMEDALDISGDPRSCNPLLATSITSTSEWYSNMLAEDFGRGENSMCTKVSKANVVSNQQKLDSSGGLKVLAESQACILRSTGDNELRNLEADDCMGKEDKENMVIDGTSRRCSVQVTCLRSSDSVLLPQETNIVSTSGSSASLPRSLSCGSGDEARGLQDMESQLRILAATVSSELDMSGVGGSLEEEKENMVTGSPDGRTSVAVPPRETNIVPVEGSLANFTRSRNCEYGDDARGVERMETEWKLPILTSTVACKQEIPRVDGGPRNEDPENMIKNGVTSRGSTQDTVVSPSDPMPLPQEISFLPITGSSSNLQRSLKRGSVYEARGSAETESAVEVQDDCAGTQCEREAKNNTLHGLLLLTGFVGETKLINSTELNTNGTLQTSWRVGEITSIVSRTRECLAQALKHERSCEVNTWIASSDLALSLANTRLSGMNLITIFTASLIDTYGWWESETSARGPSECRSVQFLFLLVREVLKAEILSQSFPSEFQTVDTFADQLQEFLIQGTVRPVLVHEVQRSPCDFGEEEITFQIPSTASDLERVRTVTSASKLLASLCLETGKTNNLRKSVYLILRHCNLDSSWLLASIASFVTVCGRQLLLAGPDDIASQAVLVVISELLHDAGGTETAEDETALADSCSGNPCEERQEKNSDGSTKLEALPSETSSTYLDILRSSVGKFENNLNFEALLPEILQLFFDVISPSFFATLLDSQHLSSDPARIKADDHIDRLFGASRVLKYSAASTETAGGASSQPWEKVEQKEMDSCCWLCGYSNNNGVRSTFSGSLDTANSKGDPGIAWEHKFHEITHAVELVAFHLGWEWTYNDLIVEHLWKRVYSGAPDTTVALVAKSLGIFGRLGIEIDGTELQGVKELRQILLTILRSGHKVAGVDGGSSAFSLTAQVASAQSLVNLCRDVKEDTENTPASGSAAHASILAWFHALDPESLGCLPSSLRCLLSNLEMN